MDNAVLVLTSVAAMNVDSYTRSFIATDDVQNGAVLKAGTLSAVEGESQVFTTEAATATDKGLYMAFSQEDTIIEIGGNQYKYGNIDPRLFTNKAGYVFSAFRLMAGDIVTIAGGIEGTANAYVVVNADGKLEYAAAATEGLCFRALENTYLIAAGAGNGGIGASHRLDAVELEVISN